MNSILNNYSAITELELNKRVAYYEHTDFSKDTIELLVPDTLPFVQKYKNPVGDISTSGVPITTIVKKSDFCRLKIRTQLIP